MPELPIPPIPTSDERSLRTKLGRVFAKPYQAGTTSRRRTNRLFERARPPRSARPPRGRLRTAKDHLPQKGRAPSRRAANNILIETDHLACGRAACLHSAGGATHPPVGKPPSLSLQSRMRRKKTIARILTRGAPCNPGNFTLRTISRCRAGSGIAKIICPNRHNASPRRDWHRTLRHGNHVAQSTCSSEKKFPFLSSFRCSRSERI